MKPASERGRRSQQALADLYAWIHSLEPEWWTVAVTFQRGPEWIRLHGTLWRVQLSFFGTRWGWTRNSHIRYMVTISLSPGNDVTPARRVALRKRGSFARVARIFGTLGYQGKWHHKHGAHFMKDLRSQAALRREVQRFRGTSFKALLGEASPRAARG